MKHLLTVFLTFWLCLTSQADDIEIYQGQSSGVRQNVMFLMDTSRSMSRWERFNVGPYDPNITYTVPINGFDPETYYYSGIVNGNGSGETEAQILHDRFLNPVAFECPSAKAVIEEEGRIMGKKFKRWDPIETRWEAPLLGSGLPRGTNRTDATWVCKSEEGHHPGGAYIETNYNAENKYFHRKRGFGTYYTNIGNGWWYYSRNIFKGNYLNYQIYERGENENGGGNTATDDRISRMSLVRGAANEAATVVNGFNLGLARFDVNDNGGFIDLPIGPVEEVREQFKSKLNSYFTYGSTPLSESYYELAKYYRGGTVPYGQVDYGKNSQSRIQLPGQVVNRFGSGLISLIDGADSDHTYVANTPSVSGSRTGNSYKSPITSSCQSENTIVLFTDGEPSRDSGANAKIKGLLNTVPYFSFPPGSGLSRNCGGNGGCADELAYFLRNYDQRPDLPGKQTIRTFVIGGFIEDTSEENHGDDENTDNGSNNDLDGIPLLKSIARHGGTTYLPGDSYQDVVNALTEVFGSASETPTTFVAPALATNTYNSLEHQDELYYAMFSTQNRADWNGNLKLYRLGADGNVIDSQGNNAIGDDYLFKDSAVSHWTPNNNPDGKLVTRGGAAEHLTKNLRIFTHLSENKGTLTRKINNTPEIKAAMGLPNSISSDDLTRILNWANRVGSDDPSNTRQAMEDPLHSRPVVITYSSSKNPNTGEVTSKSVVFASTNSGYLHAFKADKNEFKEYFSYVPKELLPNIAKYAIDPPVRKDSLYGLDGQINYWHKDINKDGQVNGEDTVILYVGMRRGGRNYYALDVTNPESPKYLWQINGGELGFERLGQSWPEMSLIKVPYGTETKVALLFGGGYDEGEDDRTSAPTNALGNAIYLVNAEDGNLLWTAGKSGEDLNNSEMTASFPSNIQPVDYNGDRITDLFFASDVAGRVWRFDINKTNTGAANFADGGIIFDANGDSSDSTYNRFYNSPSVSYFKEESGTGFLALSIGTGFRASPLSNSSSDAFYILKDYDITLKPTSYTKRTPSDLAHYALANNSYSNDSNDNKDAGWRFSLSGTSEKVLADALTVRGQIIFTTFAPNPNPNPGSCNSDLGTSKAYTIDFQGGEHSLPITKTPPCAALGNCPEPAPLVPPIAIETTGAPTPDPDCDDPDGCDPLPPTCDDGGTVVLIGTSKLGDTISRCGILKKDYWMEK